MKHKIFTHDKRFIEFDYPEKCPYCGKDLALTSPQDDIFMGKFAYGVASCIHCKVNAKL